MHAAEARVHWYRILGILDCYRPLTQGLERDAHCLADFGQHLFKSHESPSMISPFTHFQNTVINAVTIM